MKIEHDKVPVEEFTPGQRYTVAMQGRPLYTAEVVKFHGGCWATVRVEKPLDAAMGMHYQPGTTFDIKVAQYEITPEGGE
ncbi:MAG: hypothetical protein FGM32_06645 [Candidatus Kapabacteria bacterium]|nr:hypothetical protein [Candidatus Kapabacteria bacterium]